MQIMTVDVQTLENVIKASNKGKGQLAAEIGMDQATFYRKMQTNGEKFTVGEMHKIVNALNMTIDLAASIFLYINSQ